MAQEYEITRVSEQEPRTYTGDFGTTYYIKVMLKGHAKPVEIGKKSPDGLKVGDTVFGTIRPTEYPTDGFKSERKPFNASRSPRDDMAIRAQWAIGQAIALFTSGKDNQIGDIEKNAKDFFLMVDSVKAVGQSPHKEIAGPAKSGYQLAKEARAKLHQDPTQDAVDAVNKVFNDGSPVPTSDDGLDAPINLDDIPF